MSIRSTAFVSSSNVRSEHPDFARRRTVAFPMEFRDPQTDPVLRPAADSAAAPAFAYGDSSASDWGSVEKAAVHWAPLFLNILDNNLGQ